jgi:hypothetical protein
MDDFLDSIRRKEIAGIPIGAWFSFFKKFKDGANFDDILSEIEHSFKQYIPTKQTTRESVIALVEQILDVLKK